MDLEIVLFLLKGILTSFTTHRNSPTLFLFLACDSSKGRAAGQDPLASRKHLSEKVSMDYKGLWKQTSSVRNLQERFVGKYRF